MDGEDAVLLNMEVNGFPFTKLSTSLKQSVMMFLDISFFSSSIVLFLITRVFYSSYH